MTWEEYIRSVPVSVGIDNIFGTAGALVASHSDSSLRRYLYEAKEKGVVGWEHIWIEMGWRSKNDDPSRHRVPEMEVYHATIVEDGEPNGLLD